MCFCHIKQLHVNRPEKKERLKCWYRIIWPTKKEGLANISFATWKTWWWMITQSTSNQKLQTIQSMYKHIILFCDRNEKKFTNHTKIFFARYRPFYNFKKQKTMLKINYFNKFNKNVIILGHIYMITAHCRGSAHLNYLITRTIYIWKLKFMLIVLESILNNVLQY